MKQITLILFLIGTTLQPIQAQFFKKITDGLEKADQAVRDIGKPKEIKPEEITLTSTDQSELINSFRSQAYKHYIYEGGYNRITPKGEKEVTIVKEDNQVKFVYFGTYSDVKYADKYYPLKVDGSDEVFCYTEGHTGSFVLYRNTIIQFRPEGYQKPDIMRIENIYGEKIPHNEALAYVKKVQAQYRANFKQKELDAIAARKAYRAENTLESKKIAKIETKVLETKLTKGNDGTTYEKVSVGFIVTLADGKVLKTENLGGTVFIGDIKATSTANGKSSYMPAEFSFAPDAAKYKGSSGTLYYKVNEPFAKDKVEYTFSSVFDPSVTTTYAITAKYGNNLNVNKTVYNAPLRIEVTTTKHSETNEPLYLVKVTDGSNNQFHYYKLSKKGMKAHFNSPGEHGHSGVDGHTKRERDGSGPPARGSDGRRGGNGGAIEVVLDPSATDFEYTYNIAAGVGGTGGRGGICHGCSYGSHGEDGNRGPSGLVGTHKKEVKKVTFK